MPSSKLSSKGRVTIPKPVRDALDLKPGDVILFEARGRAVQLRRAEPFDAAFHAALSQTLDEWATPEDDEAFRGLQAPGPARRSRAPARLVPSVSKRRMPSHRDLRSKMAKLAVPSETLIRQDRDAR